MGITDELSLLLEQMTNANVTAFDAAWEIAEQLVM